MVRVGSRLFSRSVLAAFQGNDALDPCQQSHLAPLPAVFGLAAVAGIMVAATVASLSLKLVASNE